MISTPENQASDGRANDINLAAAAFRKDIQSRLMRLLPVLFVALISLTLLQDSPHISVSMVLQIVVCAVMILAYSFRKRLSIPKSAVIMVACLYLWGISAASVVGWMQSSALGTALALVVLQIVLGCQRRYLGTLACVASYIGVGALAYVYLKDTSGAWNFHSASTALPMLPWILMSVSFACFAFIVLIEAEKLLQRIVATQRSDAAMGTDGELRDADHATRQAAASRECSTGDFPSDIEEDNRRLRLVNRNLEIITYALSHDLRAPLRAIEGFTRALVEDAGDAIPQRAQHDVQEIRLGVDRMQRMVTQWLSFLRGDQSGMQCELVDLSQLAHDVAVELRSANPERKTVIRIEPGITAYGDTQLLRELLQNLLGNAWKFTQLNDASAIVEVGSYGNSFQTNYFVRDNGAGFTAADAPKLFTPFVRLHSGQQYDGSGIGLAIARKIVDSHGGTIWAEGQVGHGATFTFAFPNPTATSGTADTTPKAADLGRSIFDMRCASHRQ